MNEQIHEYMWMPTWPQKHMRNHDPAGTWAPPPAGPHPLVQQAWEKGLWLEEGVVHPKDGGEGVAKVCLEALSLVSGPRVGWLAEEGQAVRAMLGGVQPRGLRVCLQRGRWANPGVVLQSWFIQPPQGSPTHVHCPLLPRNPGHH